MSELPDPASTVTWQALPRLHRRTRPTMPTGNRAPASATATSTVTAVETRPRRDTSPRSLAIAESAAGEDTRTSAMDSEGAVGPSAAADVAVARTSLRLIAEIACAMRPAHQSIRWTSSSTYSWLERAHSRAAAVAARSAAVTAVAITGIHVQRVDELTIECCATVLVRRSNGATRARALAACLRQRRGSWWVTQIEW